LDEAGSVVILDFRARMEDRPFELSLSVQPGETIAVLGPNGAGKSTLLGLIAGLLQPHSGQATLGGDVLFSAAPGKRRAWTPPHRRGVSLLAQEALLFPHLSVLDNVAFGPTSAGRSKPQAYAAAREWLGEVDARELEDRKPAQLSGGQAQRIAVARALAAEPRLLLLDEPMAALDIAVAPAIRRMLRRVLRDRTAIIVTHDILDAFTLADRVIVIDRGSIVEEGPTRSVLERPRTAFTAGLAALNLLTGTRVSRGILTAAGESIEVSVESTAAVVALGADAAVAVRPSSVDVVTAEPTLHASNVIRGVVTDLEPRGDIVRVRSEHFAADILPGRAADLDLAPGAEVWFTFAASDAVLYPL
jgi:molybdate transport system ATP-binding protein